jgi:hypothetical protein
MTHADKAEALWQKGWTIRIQVGEEVIKRHPGRRLTHEAADDTVREMAVETARDEGYELAPETVAITR